MTMPSDALMVARNGGDLASWHDRTAPKSAGTTLWNIGQTLRRRVRLVIVTLIVLNLIAFAAVNSISPRYTAEATVLIGYRQARVVDLQSVIAGLSGESEVIESEMQLLRSRSIARRVAEKLQLLENEEFNPDLREPGLLADAVGMGRGVWKAVIAILPERWRHQDSQENEAATPVGPTDPMSRVIDEFQRRVGIAARGRSRVVQVTFDSRDPALAAAAANGIAESYAEEQLRSKVRATVHAHGWLTERVAELRAQVVAADEAVEAHRNALGATQGVSSSVLNEQISAASAQLSRAQGVRADAEARVQALDQVSNAPTLLYSLPDVKDAHVVRNLRQQESTLQERLAGHLRRTGNQNPLVLDTRAELNEVRARLREEAENIVRGLRARAVAARAEEAALAANLAALQTQATRSSQGLIEMRALQHEAAANHALYERLLARSKETQIESGLQQPDAQVVSRAEIPAAPSFPKRAVILPMFFIASCVFTLLLAVALESLDQGFSTLEQAERELGVAALGIVPVLKQGLGRARLPEEEILQRPDAVYGEAIRSLYVSLMLSAAGAPPRIVLLASALPGEGKSSVALSLARLMASCGKRVVMIDCDLRRPRLHRALGVAQAPGLADCLSGEVMVLDALRRDPDSPAWLLPAGTQTPTSPDLFASEQMRRLVGALAERFDLVILDSAPLLAVSDTRSLCRIADRTVLVVRWMDTRRHAVSLALRRIFEAGGSVAGVLLSQVDLQRHGRYTGGLYQRAVAMYQKA